jgi:hypothetical protein
MASNEQMQALKQSLLKHIEKAFAPLLTEDADADAKEATLTPRQKLEKQLATANDKLTKLNEKIAGGKSKIPDKDEENKKKLEETISKINNKISKLDGKEDEEAEEAPKPAPASAKAKAKKAAKPAESDEEAEKAPKPAPPPAKGGAKKAAEKLPESDEEAEEAPKPAKPAPAAKAEEAKKHVPRITPAMTTKLKEAFETVGVEWDDKYKKEFVTHVNSLSDEQFAEFGLEGHMSRLANTHAPAAAGGAGEAPAPKIKTLTVADLVKQKKNLTQVSPGVFQHKTTGEMVTGPAEDTDEEFEDKEHDGSDYIVGETTKRVYKPSYDGPDEFVGYWGIGDW